VVDVDGYPHLLVSATVRLVNLNLNEFQTQTPKDQSETFGAIATDDSINVRSDRNSQEHQNIKGIVTDCKFLVGTPWFDV
jgi:hypothetical protein